METDITGAGATARVTGAYAGHGKQHLDYETTQEHAAPHTSLPTSPSGGSCATARPRSGAA